MSTIKRGTPSKVIIVPRPGNTSSSSAETNTSEQIPETPESEEKKLEPVQPETPKEK